MDINERTLLILNGIRTRTPLDLGYLKCYEVKLRANYGESKSLLYKISTKHLKNSKIIAYELKQEGREKCTAKIYVKNEELFNEIKDELAKFIEGDIKSIGNQILSYSATENFFDMVVRLAFEKSGFAKFGQGFLKYAKNEEGYINTLTRIEINNDTSANEKYYGVLFVDYNKISKQTLADILLKSIKSFDDLKENKEQKEKCISLAKSYIGKSVLTLVKSGSEYRYRIGKIVGIEETYANEKKLNDETIYKLWEKRLGDDEIKNFVNNRLNPNEFPLFKVKFDTDVLELTYSPSLLRVFEEVTRDEPKYRWNKIKSIIDLLIKNMIEIYRKLTNKDIEFDYTNYKINQRGVGIRLLFYTGSKYEKQFKDKVVRLKYKSKSEDKDVPSHASPIFAFSNWVLPYNGKKDIRLIVIYPSSLESKIKRFIHELKNSYKKLNFGELYIESFYNYNYDESNITLSLNSLENTLNKVLEKI